MKIKKPHLFYFIISILLYNTISVYSQNIQYPNITIKKEININVKAFNFPVASNKELIVTLPNDQYLVKRQVNNSLKVYIYRVDRNGKEELMHEGERIGYFSFSKISNRLCFSEGKNFIVKDINTGETFVIPRIVNGNARDFANISPSGKQIVFDERKIKRTRDQTINSPSIIVRDLETTVEKKVANGAFAKWSPAGNLILFSRSEGSRGNWTGYIWVVKPDGSDLHKLSSSKYMGGWPVQWSRDGKYILDKDRKGDLHIVDVLQDNAVVLPTNRLAQTSPAFFRGYISETWSPDSKFILVNVTLESNPDETIIGRERYLISRDGTKIIKITGFPKKVKDMRWYNDSTLIFRDSRGNWAKTNIGRIIK